MWRLRRRCLAVVDCFMWVDEVEIVHVVRQMYIYIYIFIFRGGLRFLVSPSKLSTYLKHEKTSKKHYMCTYSFQSHDFIALTMRQAYNVSERCFCVGVALLSLLSTSGLVSRLFWLIEIFFCGSHFHFWAYNMSSLPNSRRMFNTCAIYFTLVYIHVFIQTGFCSTCSIFNPWMLAKRRQHNFRSIGSRNGPESLLMLQALGPHMFYYLY